LATWPFLPQTKHVMVLWALCSNTFVNKAFPFRPPQFAPRAPWAALFWPCWYCTMGASSSSSCWSLLFIQWYLLISLALVLSRWHHIHSG
jgi:hypothetical protein